MDERAPGGRISLVSVADGFDGPSGDRQEQQSGQRSTGANAGDEEIRRRWLVPRQFPLLHSNDARRGRPSWETERYMARNMPAMSENTSITDWPRPVVHWEIVARDAERLANFYRQLFKWRIGEGDIKQVPAGLGGPEPGPDGHLRTGTSPGISLHVQVRDMSESISLAESLGGGCCMCPSRHRDQLRPARSWTRRAIALSSSSNRVGESTRLSRNTAPDGASIDQVHE